MCWLRIAGFGDKISMKADFILRAHRKDPVCPRSNRRIREEYGIGESQSHNVILLEMSFFVTS